MSVRNLLIQGGTSLVQNAQGETNWSTKAIATSHACIDSIAVSSNEAARPLTVFDAGGLLVLPGMVDIHGDAFERQLQPRPDTFFSHDIALADTDRQLVANGITTACHGLTYSWEGGLRGRESAISGYTRDVLISSRSMNTCQLLQKNCRKSWLPTASAPVATRTRICVV